MRKATWERLGGMDERFVGYGGEETDLAARLDPAGVPLYWTAGARAYHQHHTKLAQGMYKGQHHG